MMAELTAAFTSLKAASKIAQSLIGLHDTAIINGKVLELQREIMAAQQSALAANHAQSVLSDRVRDLEKEVADLKAWGVEREKYELKQVGQRGTFAYTLKEQSGISEPPHSLCANCYQDGRKSILQAKRRSDLSEILCCPKCATEIEVKDPPPMEIPIAFV
jgi:hypothetical protein